MYSASLCHSVFEGLARANGCDCTLTTTHPQIAAYHSRVLKVRDLAQLSKEQESELAEEVRKLFVTEPQGNRDKVKELVALFKSLDWHF